MQVSSNILLTYYSTIDIFLQQAMSSNFSLCAEQKIDIIAQCNSVAVVSNRIICRINC